MVFSSAVLCCTVPNLCIVEKIKVLDNFMVLGIVEYGMVMVLYNTVHHMVWSIVLFFYAATATIEARMRVSPILNPFWNSSQTIPSL